MKLLICGGRYYRFLTEDVSFLDMLHARYQFTLVVTGGATGADHYAALWAAHAQIPLHVFPADWARYGSAAGPRRNQAMVNFCAEAPRGLVVAFPGGRGTADCIRKATARGLDVLHGRAVYAVQSV